MSEKQGLFFSGKSRLSNLRRENTEAMVWMMLIVQGLGSRFGVPVWYFTGSALGSQCKEESTGNRDKAKTSRNPCGSARGADFCCTHFAQLGAPRGLTLWEGPSGQQAGRFAGSDPTGPLVGRRDTVGLDLPICSGMNPQLEEREG